MQEDEEYSLKKSAEIARLYPCLKTEDGRIIDGLHRKIVDDDWEERTIPVEERDFNIDGATLHLSKEGDFHLLRLLANWHRRQATPQEKTVGLGLICEHMRPKPSAEQLAKLVGCSVATIYRYLPQKYKDPQLVEYGRKGGRPPRGADDDEAISVKAALEASMDEIGRLPDMEKEILPKLEKRLVAHTERLTKHDIPMFVDLIEPSANCSTCPVSGCCDIIINYIERLTGSVPACMRNRLGSIPAQKQH